MTLRTALREVVHHWRETVAVVTQVAMGIALFVIALSFVGAVQQNADDLLFGTVGATWVVQPETKEDALRVDSGLLAEMRDDIGASGARGRLVTTVTISNPQADSDRPRSAAVTTVGVDIDDEPRLADNFAMDREMLRPEEIVLTSHVADQLGVDEGDEVDLTAGTASITYTVTHVSSPKNSSFVIDTWAVVDREPLAGALHGDEDRVSEILIDAPETSTVRAAIEQAGAELDSDVSVSAWSETSWSTLMLGSTIWGVLLIVVFTATFVLVCIGLTTLVYGGLLARVSDFAVLKTAGASAGKLRRMYLLEAAVQFVIGYAAGAALGAVVVVVVNAVGVSSSDPAFTFAVGSTVLELLPTWWAFALPFAIGLVITLSILWLPIRSVCSRPILELLELR